MGFLDILSNLTTLPTFNPYIVILKMMERRVASELKTGI